MNIDEFSFKWFECWYQKWWWLANKKFEFNILAFFLISFFNGEGMVTNMVKLELWRWCI